MNPSNRPARDRQAGLDAGDARELEDLLFSAAIQSAAQPRPAARGKPIPRIAPYTPPPPLRTAPKKRDNSDFIVGAMGVTLGLVCALFPWYIFFNPEQFGVREFVFSGQRGNSTPEHVAYQPGRIGQPFAADEVPAMPLDFIPTATVARDQQQSPRQETPSVDDQPFPADLVTFRLVHVANGRAMIQDDDGLWIVQPGSRLPDASKVASIEQRNGRWVLVTTGDKVVELQN